MINSILVGMDPSSLSQKDDQVQKHSEELKEIRKELMTSIDTLKTDFTSKVSDVEKKLDGIAQSATSDSELKAQMHAQEIKLKELATQLESKTHEADHRQRVIDMYKAQNHELNLKLVKIVEDKDAQVLKLSEKVDAKLEQIVKSISEIQVPKVVERVIEKIIEKLVATSQEGGDKEQTEKTQPTGSETNKESTHKSPPKQRKETKRPPVKGIVINPEEGSSKQQPKPTEEEIRAKGKGIASSEPKATPKLPEDTTMDAELALKIAEEERIKRTALNIS